jgi:hypothetical protein
MTDETVDQRARDIGHEALNQISRHEAVCAERWRTAIETMRKTEALVRAQTAQMWAAQGFVIVALLGIIGALFSRAFPIG